MCTLLEHGSPLIDSHLLDGMIEQLVSKAEEVSLCVSGSLPLPPLPSFQPARGRKRRVAFSQKLVAPALREQSKHCSRQSPRCSNAACSRLGLPRNTDHQFLTGNPAGKPSAEGQPSSASECLGVWGELSEGGGLAPLCALSMQHSSLPWDT